MLSHEEMVSLQAEKHEIIEPEKFASNKDFVLHLIHARAYEQAALYAAGKADALTRRAADVLCRDLEMELTRRPRDDRYFRAVNELGAAIAEQGWEEIDEAPAPEVLQGYAT